MFRNIKRKKMMDDIGKEEEPLPSRQLENLETPQPQTDIIEQIDPYSNEAHRVKRARVGEVNSQGSKFEMDVNTDSDHAYMPNGKHSSLEVDKDGTLMKAESQTRVWTLSDLIHFMKELSSNCGINNRLIEEAFKKINRAIQLISMLDIELQSRDKEICMLKEKLHDAETRCSRGGAEVEKLMYKIKMRDADVKECEALVQSLEDRWRNFTETPEFKAAVDEECIDVFNLGYKRCQMDLYQIDPNYDLSLLRNPKP